MAALCRSVFRETLRFAAVGIGGRKDLLPMPDELPSLVNQFLNWLRNNVEELCQKQQQDGSGSLSSAIQLACDAHTRFVHIHPFVEGMVASLA
jgi:Fic family protein